MHRGFSKRSLPLYFVCTQAFFTTRAKTQAKHDGPNAQKLAFDSATAYLPHVAKRYRGGEDASFTSSHILSVFDGVSSWFKEDDIDAGDYAFVLAKLLEHRMQDQTYDALVHLKAIFEQNGWAGSSTACIVCLNPTTNMLHIAHIGDCAVMLFREGKLRYKTKALRHDESTPFQLGNDSKSDKPERAVCYNWPCVNEDILIVASDGLTDNLHKTQIEEAVQSTLQAHQACLVPRKLAWNLGDKAKKDGSHRDDITIVAARVCSEGSLTFKKDIVQPKSPHTKWLQRLFTWCGA